jgi:hypothetical protein
MGVKLNVRPIVGSALTGSSPVLTTKTTTMKYKDFKDMIQTLDYQAKTENSLYKLNVDVYSHSDPYNVLQIGGRFNVANVLL